MGKKSEYFCHKTINKIENKEYYVRLSTRFAPKIKFKCYGTLIDVDYEFHLEGNYKIPNELLKLNLCTSLANVTSLNVNYVSENGDYHLYRSSFTLHKNQVSELNKIDDYFNKDIYFIATLDVDRNVFNSSKLTKSFNYFANDIRLIKFINEIKISNYFPIDKLNHFYIANKYKNDYRSMINLPKDFFSWVDEKVVETPDYYFIRNHSFERISYQYIKKLYTVNIQNCTLTRSFDDVLVKLEYTINGETKMLNIDPKQLNENNINNNSLELNIKTLYNFNKKELYQSYDGVNGIYFPVPCDGKIKIELTKNKKKYTDVIPFSFNNNFYSSSNTNINITVTDNIDLNSIKEWEEITYA